MFMRNNSSVKPAQREQTTDRNTKGTELLLKCSECFSHELKDSNGIGNRQALDGAPAS